MDLRSNFFLVETSDAKIPSASTLGNSRGLMSRNNNNGHIPKNMQYYILYSSLSSSSLSSSLFHVINE